MNKISISFMTLKTPITMEINISSNNVLNFIYELFSKFSHEIDPNNASILLSPLQKNTLEIRQSVNLLVKKYSKDIPSINNLNSLLKEMDNDEYFYMIVDSKKYSTEEKYKLYAHLKSLNIKGYDFNQEINETSKIFKDVWGNYNTIIKSDKYNLKDRIGERERKKRVCHFCKKTFETGATFKKEAHAISEALGNKNIILNEECDECNEYFGKTIESSLITYLDLYRVFFGILNKDNKIPTIKGKNFEFRNNGKKEAELFLYNENKNGHKLKFPPDKVLLKFNQKIVKQDIYKALVKYAISVIDSLDIKIFNKTIEWIRTPGFYKESLPKIGHLVSYRMFSEKPSLTVYLRKNDDKTLPYAVGHFNFTCFIYVFIIPLFKDEKIDFINEEEFNHFWTTFKCYDDVKEFKFEYFNDPIERDVQFEIKFKQNQTI